MRGSVSSKLKRTGRMLTFAVATAALVVQPLLQLNLPAVFASTVDTVVDETFDSFDGSTSFGGWNVVNTGKYESAASCGVAANCVKFVHDDNASATLTLPLTSSQKAKTLSFYLNQISAGDDSDSEVVVEQFEDTTSIASGAYSSSQTNLPLNEDTTKIVFSLPLSSGNNLALDDVVVTAETATAVTNTVSGTTYDTLQEAIDAADAGDALQINENMTISQRVNVTKPLTINGQNHVVSPNFAGPGAGNSNNATLGLHADNITLNDLTVDGVAGTSLHGIITYQVVGVVLNNVTINNNDRSGLVVNGSTVTLNNISTANNPWSGINVDLGTGVAQPAVLTMMGTSTHNEPTADIYVDDDSKKVTVNAPAYDWFRSGRTDSPHPNDRVYRLSVGPTAQPTVPSTDGTVIFNTLPAPFVSNMPSLGYQAAQTAALGDKITFAGNDRHLEDVQVNLSSWACEAGSWNAGTCATTPGATFTHPVTLNIYNVANDGTTGSLIESKTQIFTIPYRPSANPACDDGKKWMDTNGDCFSGINHVVTFDMSGVVVPDTVIYSVSYNTSSYGTSPMGTTGPYDSLNVGFNTIDASPSVGTDVDSDEVFWDTTYSSYTAGLKADGGWDGYMVAAKFTATTPDLTAPKASDVVVEPLDSDNVTSGSVKVTFTLDDDSSIDLRKGKTHVRFMTGKDESGATVSSPQYVVTPVAGTTNRYQATVTTADFVPSGTEATGFHVYIRSQDSAGNATAKSFFEGTDTIDVDNKAPVISNITVGNPIGGTVNVDVTLEDTHMILEDSRFTFVRFVTGKELVGAASASSAKYGLTHLSGNTYRAVIDTTDFVTTGASGSYLLYVSAQDVHSNKSWDNTTRDIVVDNNAPDAPTITNPTPRKWLKSTPILNTWTAVSDITGVDHYQIAYAYDDGHSFGGSTCPGVTISGASGFIGCRDVDGTQRNHTPNSSEQGGVTIWVRAIDGVGNVGPWSESVHYYYDETVPTTTIDAPTDLAKGIFTVSGTAEDNLQLNRVYVQLVNRDDNKRYGGTTISLISEGKSANWIREYNVATDTLPDGTYSAHVSVVDMAGNTSSAGWTDNFVVDSTDPGLLVTTPESDVTVSLANGPYTTSGNATDANGVDRVVLYVTDENGDRAYRVVTRDFDSSTGAWSIEVPSGALADGEYTFNFNAYDNAGNLTTVRHKVTVDSTAPLVAFTRPTKTTIFLPGNVTIQGTVDDPAASKVNVNFNGETKQVDVDASGQWSALFENVPNGQYDLVATAEDVAGNVGEATITDVPVDAVPVSIITPQLPTPTSPENEQTGGNGVTTQTPLQQLLPFALITPQEGVQVQTAGGATQTDTTGIADTEVLADESSSQSDRSVKSAETTGQTQDDDESATWSIFGLAWYWWLLILAAITGLMVAVRARSSDGA